MYSLILIDDEQFSVNVVKRLLPWESYGFNLINAFTNSIEALDFIKNNHIDVVLTDITMPDVSGIDIAQYCYYHSPNTIVVFLSAYSDFEYAKLGIQYQVFNYLNKPIMKSTLSKTLSDIYSKLNQASHKSQFIQSTTNSIIKKCFVDIISDNSNDDVLTHLDEVGINIDFNKSIFAYISFDHTNYNEYLKTKWTHGRKKLVYALEQIINAEHPLGFSAMTYFYDTGFDIFLVSKPEISEHIFAQFLDSYSESLTTLLKECLYMDISKKRLMTAKSISELKEYVREKDNNQRQYISKHKTDALEKAKQYIEENYSENISLGDIASTIGFEASYFSKIFKKHFGISFSDYLSNIRLEAAKDLLVNSDIKITQIPLMIGLSNFSNFSKQFKLHTNYLPSEYRNKYGKM